LNWLILLAAGKGKRIGFKLPKALIKLKKKPLFFWSLEKFDRIDFIQKIMLMVPRGFLKEFDKLISCKKFKKEIYLGIGGRRRMDSVLKALRKIDKGDYLFIHDSARPFIERELLEKLYREVKKYKAVIPALPISFTIKKVLNGFVDKTLEREELYEIQTPQAFEFNLFKEACFNFNREKFTPLDSKHLTGFTAYDDSQLLEKIGFKVKVIEGSPYNIKITYPYDLNLAESISNLLF
jgi:2-C-methyl-D-erythritol 4-phosphate cytidylyltransferase